MKPQSPPVTAEARLIPGLALFQGLSPAVLRTHAVSAVTVFAVLVPSAMAYGDLAGITPVAGLYVAVPAMVIYALFGTSRQLVMGPEATTAILTATAVAPLAGGDPVRYAALAAALSILIGIVALLGGIAKLGLITDFLSKPILIGYITGTTLIVIGSQLPKLFGIKTENRDFFPQPFELLNRLDETHLLTPLRWAFCRLPRRSSSAASIGCCLTRWSSSRRLSPRRAAEADAQGPLPTAALEPTR